MSVDQIYEDKNGKRWGYISYYYTHSGWICIDDLEYIVADEDIDCGESTVSDNVTDGKEIIKPGVQKDNNEKSNNEETNNQETNNEDKQSEK